MSFRSRLRTYRIISVSDRCVLNTGCVMNGVVRRSDAGSAVVRRKPEASATIAEFRLPALACPDEAR